MIRSVIAVLAGLLVTFLLVMLLSYVAPIIAGIPINAPPTPGYIAMNLLGGAIAGAAGGATAAKIAAHTPHGHVLALAVAILLLSLPTLLSAPAPGQPTWYPLVLSVLGPTSVIAGGFLAIRRIGGNGTRGSV